MAQPNDDESWGDISKEPEMRTDSDSDEKEVSQHLPARAKGKRPGVESDGQDETGAEDEDELVGVKGKTPRAKRPAKEKKEGRETVPGNNNFAKASQRRVIGYEKIANGDRGRFHATTVNELKQRLKDLGQRVGGIKVELFLRYKEQASVEEFKMLPKGPDNEEDEEDDRNGDDQKSGGEEGTESGSEDGDSGEDEAKDDKVDNEERDVEKSDRKDFGIINDTKGEIETDIEAYKRRGDHLISNGAEPVGCAPDVKMREAERHEDGNEDQSEDGNNGDQAAKFPLQNAFVTEGPAKRRRNSNSSRGSKRAKHANVDLRGGAGDKDVDTTHVTPTDYYIPQNLLDQTLQQLLVKQPDLFQPGAPVPPNHDITFREYLRDNPKARLDMARSGHMGDQSFPEHDEEMVD
ncbi:hypothetical protein TruAng_008185 [Truncatella angustata]|nr:hypothetical protein TruAng_008185 [Truncatella angustata]